MKHILVILILFSITILSCKKDTKNNDSLYTYQASHLKLAYIQSQRILLKNLVASCSDMHSKSNLFNSYSIQNNLVQFRNSWKNTYENFVMLSPYKYSYESIDIGYNNSKHFYEFYPINYRYIDYSEDNPSGGIINDLTNYPQINFIHTLHQLGDNTNCTIGFQVLEFLLWGEDLSLSTPGTTRDNQDYTSVGTNVSRRKDFLAESENRLNEKILSIKINEQYEKRVKDLNTKEFINLFVGSLQKWIKNEIVQKDILLPVSTQNHHLEICDFSDHTMVILKKKIEAIHLFLDGRSLFFTSGNSTNYFLIDFISEIMPEQAEIIQSNLKNIDNLLESIPVTFENAVVTPLYSSKLEKIASHLTLINDQLDLVLLKFK